MKRKILAMAIAFACIQSTATFAQLKKSSFHGGFIYPISSHGLQASHYSNAVSVHALAGVSGEERAFAVSGISLYVKENASGFKASGISNTIGGRADGFTAAGIVNTYRNAKGFQAAGLVNIAKDSVDGMQAAGLFNSAGYVDGLQAGGFMNRAGNVEGSQMAGFINIAQKVKGVQMSGFINIADSSDYPIGIINIIRNGEQWAGVTTDDNQTTLLTFRSGSRKVYGIIGMGANLKNEKDVFALQMGLGANLVNTKMFRLKSELTHTMLENFSRGSFSKYSLGFLPSMRLGKIEIFAGPSINLIQTNTAEGKGLVNNFLWDRTTCNDQLNGLYIGYTGGIQWRL